MAKSRLGGAKTFGARYGRTLRDRVASIRALTKQRNKCPYCNYSSVKRLATGIFYCKKCNTKFAGRAYAPAKQIVVRTTVATEEIVEAKEEAKEKVEAEE